MKYSPSFIRGTAVGTVLSIGILAAVPVLAFRGDDNARGPHFSPERHEQMQEILETGDYDVFRSLIEESGRRGQILDTITKENFSTFVEMHNLMKSGDREGAKELREKLSLNLGNGPMLRQGRRGGMRGYEAWGGGKMMDFTEEERQKLQESLQECRDNAEGWEEIRECRKALIDRFQNQEQK